MIAEIHEDCLGVYLLLLIMTGRCDRVSQRFFYRIDSLLGLNVEICVMFHKISKLRILFNGGCLSVKNGFRSGVNGISMG